MPRDIDYAAVAVNSALIDKYGRQNDLAELTVTANERTITVQHGAQRVEGTRDNLLASIRAAENYEKFWQQFPASRSAAG